MKPPNLQGQIVSILMVLALLVGIIVMRKDCGSGVSKMIGAFAVDAGTHAAASDGASATAATAPTIDGGARDR